MKHCQECRLGYRNEEIVVFVDGDEHEFLCMSCLADAIAGTVEANDNISFRWNEDRTELHVE